METATEDRLSPPRSEGPGWITWAILCVGLAAVSVSPILLRLASDAPPLALSFWRCAAGAGSLAPFALRRLRAGAGGSYVLPVVSGAFLAVHFATWITSLQLTTVAASVLLVSTTPIFVALAARLFVDEHLSAIGWTGIFLAVGGAGIIGGADLSGSNALGNLLALIGGATAGGYVFTGGLSRRSLGLVEYATIAYAVAGVLLLGACVVAGTDLVGYDAPTWGWIALVIVGPQLLGHTVINFVLGDIDATTVSVTIMAEPIVATALAFLIFEEVPAWVVFPGGAAVLLGIYLVTRTQRAPGAVVD